MNSNVFSVSKEAGISPRRRSRVSVTRGSAPLVLAVFVCSFGLCSRLQANDVPAAPDFVYTKQFSDSCVVYRFDTQAGKANVLTTLQGCPEAVYVSPVSASLYFLQGGNLHIVELDTEPAQMHKFALPDDDFEAHRDRLDIRVRDERLPSPDANRLEPWWAGALSDGRTALAMSLGLIADDYIALLFVHDSKEWRIEGQRHCGQWEWPCIFPGFEAEQEDWDDAHWERRIWSVDPTSNPFVTVERFEQIPSEYGGAFAERRLRFDISGSTVVVEARGEYSAHGLGIYTYSVNVSFRDSEDKDFDLDMCDVWFLGRYLLVGTCHDSESGNVYDMASGRTVVESSHRFTWID